MHSIRSHALRLLIIATSLIMLTACGSDIANLPLTAKQLAIEKAAAVLSDTRTCLEERVVDYDGKDFADFVSSLGPCINVYLLDKSDEQIANTFRPSGSGTYATAALADSGNTLVLVTAGTRRAVASTWQAYHTIVVCWSVQLDLGTGTSSPQQAECNPVVVESWGKPRDELPLDSLISEPAD